jgi:hypothetical protein
MMPSALCQALVDRLEAGKIELGLKKVWYADQQLIPEMPAAAVEVPEMTREMSGTGQATTNTYETSIFVYHSQLQDVNLTRKECAELGEAVMDYLHQDLSLNGLLVHSFVNRLEPGYAQRTQGLIQAVRLNWTGLTRTRLGA